MEQVTDAGIAPAAIDGMAGEGHAIVERVEIPMPFVVIATPSYDGTCAMAHRASMIELRGHLVQRGIPHVILDRSGMTYLDRVRDFLATQFLEDWPDATDLFFIDADVGFPADKVIEFLIRPEPLLLGAPPLKNDDDPEVGTYPVRFLADAETHRLVQNNGYVKIDRGPAGFLRIKRAVLQAIIEAEKAVVYREPETQRLVRHFFSCGVSDDGNGELTYWGEDAIFLARAAHCGIEAWLDPNITFAHFGRKTWQGNCLRALFRKHGVLAQPESLHPVHVVAGGETSPVPQIEAAMATDYPKYVHGLVAQDAEDESKIEREWQAANPGAVAPTPEPVDLGTPPDGVSASTPVVAEAEQSTAELEAKIEADLSDAAALTVQIAAPAAAPVDEAAPISGTVAQPVEQPIPALELSAEESQHAGAPESSETAPPVAEAPAVEQTAAVDTGANLAETLVEQPQTVEVGHGLDTGAPAAEAAAPQEGENRDTNNPELNPAADQSVNAPAAEPAAAQAVDTAAPASESPVAEEPSPAAEQVEAAQVAEPVQEAPAETPIAALDVGAATAAAGAPEPISAPGVAAEVEQPAPGAPLAASDGVAAIEVPAAEPAALSPAADLVPPDTQPASIAADSGEPAAAVANEQHPAEAPAQPAAAEASA